MDFTASSALKPDDGGHDQGEALQVLRLERAHGSAGNLAQFGGGKGLGLAATDQQQALGLESGGLVQERDLHRLAGDFAGGDEVGSSVDDGLVVGQDLRFGFVFVAVLGLLGGVDDGDDETFGFNLRRYSSSKS